LQGYSRMSLDAIPIEAGVSKPTIYRRSSSKADLATAAIRTLQLAELPVSAGTIPRELTGIPKNYFVFSESVWWCRAKQCSVRC